MNGQPRKTKYFKTHTSCLRRLLEDVLPQNEGVSHDRRQRYQRDRMLLRERVGGGPGARAGQQGEGSPAQKAAGTEKAPERKSQRIKAGGIEYTDHLTGWTI